MATVCPRLGSINYAIGRDISNTLSFKLMYVFAMLHIHSLESSHQLSESRYGN